MKTSRHKFPNYFCVVTVKYKLMQIRIFSNYFSVRPMHNMYDLGGEY